MNQQVVPLPLPPTAAPEAVDLSSNATSWYNITAWTVNVTRYAPSLEDLVWAGPRMFKKLGSYMALAEPLDDGTSTGFFGSLSPNIFNTMGNAAAENADGAQEAASQASRFSLGLDKAGGLASLATYLTSRWALSCIAMALILNRTHIFAATRRKLRLHWHIRLALRLLPVIFLTMQVRRLLMSIQCQTSADFSELRWGNSSMSSDFMFAYNNPFLNTMSSTLLFGATDEQSCINVRMIPSDLTDGSKQLRGSLSGLWPLFTTYCLSHFIETISCALQGRPLSAETGMTLFEQSLAFAEADSTVNSQLGNLKFSNARPSDSSGATSTAVTTLTRSMVLQRVNTSPEVLLVAFLSSMTHLSSHILGIFDLQSKYRLFNTGFWGMCFMGSIVWGVFTFDIDDTSTHSILRFPTVCIIGFVPHLMVLAGILICLSIYGVALLLSTLSPPENEERSSMSFRQRIVYAHGNMQANVSLAEVRLTWDMDFYTALLRTGFAAITMASEAVYLNEDRGVSLRRHTWLDESRYREAEELQRQWVAIGPSGNRYDQVGAVGLIPIKEGPVDAPSGFARERAAQEVIKFRGGKNPRSGVGAAERSSRWLMATDFFMSIARLVFRIWATMVLGFLRVVRISRQPAWLLWMAQRPKYSGDDSRQQPQPVSRWPRRRGRFMNRGGTESGSEGMDVEAEFRRVGRGQSESKLDKDLYHYFLEGGWWGSGDASGDYQPDASDDDWDVTSVVTTTTAADETDIETGDETDNGWESEDPGQRTPTQTTPRMSRGGTPVADSPMGMTDLARLLRPANKEERDEAATLAAHLVNDGIMTRAGYKRLEQLRRTRVLGTPIRPNASATAAPSNTDRPLRLSPEAEENLLEQILLSKRQEGAAAAAAGPSTPTPSTSHNALAQGRNFGPASPGAADDDQPPQCVVCQCMPRTIIVWPCRCLSLCDDCRVSLAMNNFDKCVCCRREVLSFSRIFMP